MRAADRGDAGALRRRVRHLVVGAGRCASRARSRRRSRGCASAATSTSSDGRGLAADHGVRRRQGPGPDPLRRRADLLRVPTSPTTSTSSSAGSTALIDVLGADHHGYVARMRAALAALGFDPERFEALIMQLVNIVEGGERAQMSQAQRRLRHPRRADRRHRRRRGALLHAAAQPRHADRHRPRAGPLAVAGQPRLLRPVRARADREHPAQGGRGGRGRTRRASAAIRDRARRRRRAEPSGPWSAAARAARRGREPRPSAGRRTGSARTRRRPPPTSTPSTATARWSASRTTGRRRAPRRAARALRRHQADDRHDARPARGERSGADVSLVVAALAGVRFRRPERTRGE